MAKRILRTVTMPDDPAIVGYIAGLLDGEGNIQIKGKWNPKSSVNVSHALTVCITTTNPKLALWLKETLSANLDFRKRKNPRYASCYAWTVNSRAAAPLLRAVLPYLIVKREQAEVALAFLELTPKPMFGIRMDSGLVAQKEVLKQRLHVLNARGVA